jgi:hypothetical protein
MRQLSCKPTRGAHRNSGFPDHQARPVEQWGERADAAVYLGQVGTVTARLRRRARADEVHIAEHRGPRVGGGERQTPGIQPGLQEFPEPWLINGELPGVQLVYLPGVCVDAENLKPKARHAGGMRDAQVSGPEHSQP